MISTRLIFSTITTVPHRIFTPSRLMGSTSTGPVQALIEKTLSNVFKPHFLKVINESYKHSVPKGSESHFQVVIVSDSFNGQKLIQRHRSVNGALKEQIKIIHALAIQAKTSDEWQKSENHIESTPNCLGGAKREAALKEK